MSRQRSTLEVALVATVVLICVSLAAGAAADAQEVKLPHVVAMTSGSEVDRVLVDLQERTFRFFWDTANPENGLIPDRYPTPSYSSIEPLR